MKKEVSDLELELFKVILERTPDYLEGISRILSVIYNRRYVSRCDALKVEIIQGWLKEIEETPQVAILLWLRKSIQSSTGAILRLLPIFEIP